MAVQNNRTYKPGDVLRFVLDPLIGVDQFISFTDTVIGETSTRFFIKRFRFAKKEGLFFTDYQEFNNTNLSNIVFDDPTLVWMEIEYERTGNDTEGELYVDDININADYSPMITNGYPKLSESFYKEFYDFNIDVLKEARNLLKKAYYRGSVSKVLLRENTDNPEELEKDFVQFFNSICTFIALKTVYAKRLEGFNNTRDLMSMMLTQRTFFFDDNCFELDKLKVLAVNLYREIKKRGTKQIFDRGDDSIPTLNGEFLRIINYKEGDELLWALLRDEQIGWNLGNSSPMYRSAEDINSFNKSYEKTEDILDLAKYPLVQPTFISLATVGSRETMQIFNPTSESGINSDTFVQYEPEKAILIDNTVDYSLTFYIRQENFTDGRISFGIKSFDSSFNELQNFNSSDGTQTNLAGSSIVLPVNDEWYFVRVILFNKDKNFSLDQPIAKTNLLGSTNNLISNQRAKYITPIITLLRASGTADIRLNIWNVRFTPLVFGKTIEESFGKGYINGNNLLNLLAKSNNNFLSISKIEENCQKFIFPYNASSDFTWL